MPRLQEGHTALNLTVYDHRRVANLNRILADLDFALALEIEKLKLGEGNSGRVRAQIDTLREKYQLCREPFVRRLAQLSTEATG